MHQLVTRLRLILISWVMLSLFACSGVKKIPEGSYLLDKNTIKTDQTVYRDNLQSILKQKPNRKILGIYRFYLQMYQLGVGGRENGFKRWLKKIGEPPVLIDTVLTERSRVQLRLFMNNQGFFECKVSDSTSYKGRKASVHYLLESGEPYRVKEINYQITDTLVRDLIESDSTNCLIRKGDLFSTSILTDERNRINAYFKSKGYYYFSPIYIRYRADTVSGDHEVRLYIQALSPGDKDSSQQGSAGDLRYTECFIRDIFIETDYDPLKIEKSRNSDSLLYNRYTFITNPEAGMKFKPSRLLDHIFIYPDSLYRQRDSEISYQRISGMGLFKFVNIQYYPIDGIDSLGRKPLRCEIQLSQQARHDYKIEAEGTNNGGAFGINGNLSYRNKNFFNGGELFQFKIRGGLEAQRPISSSSEPDINGIGVFNAWEFGVEAGVKFHRFLTPFNMQSENKAFNPETSVQAGYTVQNRIEYRKRLFNVSLFYSWTQNQSIRHFVYPAEVNYVYNDLSPDFLLELIENGSLDLLSAYNSIIIGNARYTFLYNNQSVRADRSNHQFFRFSTEFAGNMFYLIDQIRGREGKGNTLFDVPYAQYIRPDIDLRNYQRMGGSKSWVSRLSVGCGIPYGNSEVLAYEKSFFGGGPNDLRAWRSRTVGPGSFTNTDEFEKYGDLQINANLEYRFNLTPKLFRAAFFVDAGNVWTLKPTSRTGSVFEWKDFYEEFAIGGGAGLRFDFNFFILRLDGAYRFSDPSKVREQRWVLDDQKWNDMIINFGIGYPF